MRSVGIKVLKNNLSEYIRIASQGETILVTNRGRVVAEITPPHSTRSDNVADALLSETVRNGWVTPPLLRAKSMPRKPVAPLAEILANLDGGRCDR